MAEKTGNGRGSMAADTKIHQKGMSDRSAKFPDKSMGLGRASVSDEAVRKETAPTPRTIGDGRVA